jgi:hypothetical protein
MLFTINMQIFRLSKYLSNVQQNIKSQVAAVHL